MKPILIATFGYPGSGKTYFSEKLAEDLNCAHLRSDDFRFRIIPKPTFSNEEHTMVFGLIDFLAEKFLSNGVNVVYDVNLTKKRHRDRVRRIADNTNSHFVLISIETPFEIAVQRAKDRELHSIDRRTVEAISDEYEDLSSETYIKIDGLKTYDEQKDIILKQISDKTKNGAVS